MTFKTAICVRYKEVDGWHVFHSDDVAGLYVASPDPERAYQDVGPAIEMLMKLNMDIDCKAAPALEFEEFVATLKSGGDSAGGDVSIKSDKRFVLTGAVA